MAGTLPLNPRVNPLIFWIVSNPVRPERFEHPIWWVEARGGRWSTGYYSVQVVWEIVVWILSFRHPDSGFDIVYSEYAIWKLKRSAYESFARTSQATWKVAAHWQSPVMARHWDFSFLHRSEIARQKSRRCALPQRSSTR